MLIAKDLSFKRNEKTIFRDINISLSKNQIVQIKGRNGSGKTTLIKILSNILQPSNGDIYWQGKKKIYLYRSLFIQEDSGIDINIIFKAL